MRKIAHLTPSPQESNAKFGSSLKTIANSYPPFGNASRITV